MKHKPLTSGERQGIMYQVFTRNWWRKEKNKLVPNPGGRKTSIQVFNDESEARAFCQEGNKNRPWAWYELSRKYEYMSI